MAFIKIRTNRLQKDMIIASDVYTHTGAMIIPKNTRVTKEICDLLTKHFINDVIVDYSVAPPKTSQPSSKEPVNAQQLAAFQESFQIAEETLSQSLKDIAYQDKDIDIPSLLDMVNSVIEKSGNDMNLCDMLFQMKQSAESLYAHSINVSLYAQLLTKWANYTAEETELVGVAGLLHDIGILKCQQEGMTQICFHDEMEKKSGDKHVIYGYNLIKDKDIDSRIKQAVLTHHERIDRSGFPLGVSFDNINSTSRILAIADIYDTLTMDEPGRSALSPFEAIGLLQDRMYNKFDSSLLMIFCERIAQNFLQYDVLLSTGQTGKIIMLNKFDLTRPLVQVDDYFIDLSLKKEITIKQILNA
ncbi:MAG: HD domain-containing protein [Lachnospiraceae bacterium]|nr:HD domain-containing protein [Lachnospiraceae bacterium]